jgi:hypothetical protein
MADWYVSSVAYAAVPVWQASPHAYAVGDFIRPVTPASLREYVFRCTTAGTSGATEPSYPIADGNTVVSGGATFTNVSGRSAHGWSAAAGTLGCISSSISNRAVGGDRIFLSSDHNESTNVTSFSFGSAGFSLIQLLSVNRAGSVPPVAADYQSGAVVGTTNSNIIFDNVTDTFWQGISLVGKSGGISGNILFGSTGSGMKAMWFKDCPILLPSTAASKIMGDGQAQVVFENSIIQFGAAGSGFTTTGVPIFTWLGGSLSGPTVPTALFANSSGNPILFTARGVDLSLLTGNIINAVSGGYGASKVLLDSCRIAAAVTRLGTTGTNAGEELELVNCYDGTNVINERYSPAGACTADRATYMNGGAQDDGGNYALKLVSSTRADKRVLTLDNFWFDIENAFTGASKTATVEIIGSGSLNNDEISLLLEYMGGVAATWNPSDKSALIALSNANLTATSSSTNTGVRATQGVSSGKYYCEFTMGTLGYVGFAQATTAFNSTTLAVMVAANGWIQVNGSSVINIGAMANPVCVAIDQIANLAWFKGGVTGWWNGNATYNPATGVGGVNISAIAGTLFPAATTMLNGDVVIFTPASVAGAVPSGFSLLPVNASSSIASFVNSLPNALATASALPTSSNTWTNPPATPVKQLLQATFTPQRIGRVRGLVRLGKPSTTVWVNPQIAIV